MPEQRRPLVEGLKPPPAVAAREADFVYGAKAKPATEPATVATPAQARAPISTRIRADYAAALKRASLERQLAGQQPHTLQDILEQAIGPWLKNNGYLP